MSEPPRDRNSGFMILIMLAALVGGCRSEPAKSWVIPIGDSTVAVPLVVGYDACEGLPITEATVTDALDAAVVAMGGAVLAGGYCYVN